MFDIIYFCTRCDHEFLVRQQDTEKDPDITLCWTCIDDLLVGPGSGRTRYLG